MFRDDDVPAVVVMAVCLLNRPPRGLQHDAYIRFGKNHPAACVIIAKRAMLRVLRETDEVKVDTVLSALNAETNSPARSFR